MDTQVLEAPQTEVAQPQPKTQVAIKKQVIDRKMLIRELKQLVKVAKSQKNGITLFEDVMLVNVGDGFVMAAYNHDALLSVRSTTLLPISIVGTYLKGVYTVNADLILKFLTLISQNVSLVLDVDSLILTICTDTMTYKMAVGYDESNPSYLNIPNQALIADADVMELDVNLLKQAIQFGSKELVQADFQQVYVSIDVEQKVVAGVVATNGFTCFRYGNLTEFALPFGYKVVDLLPDGNHDVRVIDKGKQSFTAMVQFDTMQYFVLVTSDKYNEHNHFYQKTLVNADRLFERTEHGFIMVTPDHVRQWKPLVNYANRARKQIVIDMDGTQCNCSAFDVDYGTECEVTLRNLQDFGGRFKVGVNHTMFETAMKTSLIHSSFVRVGFGPSNKCIKFEVNDLLIVVMPSSIDNTVVEVSEPTQAEPQAE